MKYHRIIVLAPLFFFNAMLLVAQHTVGLLSYDPTKTLDGYNLIYPHNQPNVFLLNNCGEVVHVWQDDNSWRPGNTAYLEESGNLIKTKRQASIAGNAIWTGGGGAIIEGRDWDNNLLWSFERNNDSLRIHHDIEVMPNGHILAIQWEAKTKQECIAAGRDSTLLANGVMWPDGVIEIDPQTGEVVWEWHAWDHLIQDFDGSRANFGNVSEHPELIDFNFGLTSNGASWMHTNAIDYHPVNDLIMISVPTFSEIWVIDHSTSTAQAAGHSGGFGGRGGDLMYRWGNPQAYRAGTENDQKLFFQHDAHWAFDFLEFGDPNYGKIAVFNNRVGADYSTANLFDAPFDMYMWAFPQTNGVWGPELFDISIIHPNPQKMYSTGLSSVQPLPNGNTLICVGQSGYSFEITPENEVVWEYITPLKNGNPVSQGDTIKNTENNTFRMTRYPMGFKGFEGRELNALGWVETKPDSTFCDLLLSVNEHVSLVNLKLFPNPASDLVELEWTKGERLNLQVVDMLGRTLEKFQTENGSYYLRTSTWAEGIYFIFVNGEEVHKLVVKRK